MNNKIKFGLIALVAIPLLAAARFQLESQASRPQPFLAELLLRMDDLPEGAGWFEGEEPNMIEDIAKFVGLSEQNSGLLEGEGVYFVGGYPGESPKSIIQLLYRYQTAEQARSQFERLLQEAHASPLGRSTPIVDRSEVSLGKVKGQIIETSDPIGTAYWFIGRHEDTLMILATLGPDQSGQKQLLDTVLPTLIKRIGGTQ